MLGNALVSIIVPTYNSAKTLQFLLKSIRHQTYKNIEVIVVDNYSEDGTREIARSFGARVVQIKGERAKAKNVGLREARGDYVLFVDSDMILTPRVVEECVALIQSRPEVGGVVIPERSVGGGYWVRVRDFERSFYAGTPIESARFFPRELALKAGGFDEDVVFFEEATLPRKIAKMGFNVYARIQSYILHYEGDFSLRRWLQKKYYYSKSAPRYLEKYNDIGFYQVNPLYRLKLFLLDKRFYSRPTLAFGVLILKALEYTISLVGFLVARQ